MILNLYILFLVTITRSSSVIVYSLKPVLRQLPEKSLNTINLLPLKFGVLS